MNDYMVAESTLLTHARIFSLQSDKDIQNGAIVGKGDLIDGETSVYEAIDDFSDDMYLALNPAWSYLDNSVMDQNEENYINKAGVAFRAYRLEKDMKFKIYNIEDTFEVGDIITFDSDSQKYTTDADGSLKVTQVEHVGFPYCVGSYGAPLADDGDNEYGYALDARTTKYTIEKIK